MAQRGAREQRLEPEQRFQISESAILSGGINLLHHSEPLRIADVGGQRKIAQDSILDAGVIKIRKRAATRCCASCIAERPRLKYASSAIPKVVGVAQAQRVKLA